MTFTPRIVATHEHDPIRSLHDRYARVAHCERALAVAALRLEHWDWPVDDEPDAGVAPRPIRRTVSPYVQRLRRRVRESLAYGTVRGDTDA